MNERLEKLSEIIHLMIVFESQFDNKVSEKEAYMIDEIINILYDLKQEFKKEE